MTPVFGNIKRIYSDIRGGSPGRRRKNDSGVVDDAILNWRFGWISTATSSETLEIRPARLYGDMLYPLAGDNLAGRKRILT